MGRRIKSVVQRRSIMVSAARGGASEVKTTPQQHHLRRQVAHAKTLTSDWILVEAKHVKAQLERFIISIRITTYSNRHVIMVTYIIKVTPSSGQSTRPGLKPMTKTQSIQAIRSILSNKNSKTLIIASMITSPCSRIGPSSITYLKILRQANSLTKRKLSTWT